MEAKRDSPEASSWWGRLLIAVGLSGAAFAALCCFAPFLIGGSLTAIGLGFILKDAILIGLLVIFIGIASVGLYLGRRKRT